MILIQDMPKIFMDLVEKSGVFSPNFLLYGEQKISFDRRATPTVGGTMRLQLSCPLSNLKRSASSSRSSMSKATEGNGPYE